MEAMEAVEVVEVEPVELVESIAGRGGCGDGACGVHGVHWRPLEAIGGRGGHGACGGCKAVEAEPQHGKRKTVLAADTMHVHSVPRPVLDASRQSNWTDGHGPKQHLIALPSLHLFSANRKRAGDSQSPR
jgi:uncharacterized low-complexity protein